MILPDDGFSGQPSGDTIGQSYEEIFLEFSQRFYFPSAKGFSLIMKSIF